MFTQAETVSYSLTELKSGRLYFIGNPAAFNSPLRFAARLMSLLARIYFLLAELSSCLLQNANPA